MNREKDAIDYHDDLEDFEDIAELKELQALEQELNDTVFRVGYDSGYAEGMKANVETMPQQLQDMVYDAALSEIIEHIKGLEVFDKHTLITELESLRNFPSYND